MLVKNNMEAGTPMNGNFENEPRDFMINQSDPVQFGRDFYNNSMTEFDKALYGEFDAKLGYLAAAASGKNVMLLGPPGGGKSIAMLEFHRIFGQMGEHDIKMIPPQSDLTGKQVTGGTLGQMKEVTDGDGQTRYEFTSTTIEAILHPLGRIIVADEVNRASAMAIGSMLEGLESGRVINNDGIHNLDNLLFSISALNPPSRKEKTVFPLSPAFISRFPIGSRMGEEEPGPIIAKALEKTLSRPESMLQVATFDDVEHLQALARDISVEGSVLKKSVPLIEYAHEALLSEDVNEAVGRFAVQITQVASGLAVLSGSQHVRIEDIVQATRFGMNARLGASEDRKGDEVEKIFNDKIALKARLTDEELQWQ